MLASIILVLLFSGIISLETAIACLYVTGALMLLAEIGVVSLGLLTVNGLLSIYAAYALQTGNTMLLSVDIGWNFLFAVAFVEFVLLFAGIWLWKTLLFRKQKVGTESMIGQTATVTRWSGFEGKISFEGETWNAMSRREVDINAGDKVRIADIEKLTLVIEAAD